MLIEEINFYKSIYQNQQISAINRQRLANSSFGIGKFCFKILLNFFLEDGNGYISQENGAIISLHIAVYLVYLKWNIDPRPSTNQSASLKSGSLFLVMVSVRTKLTDQRVKPFFNLVLWLVFERRAWYDSSLVYFLPV